MERPGPGSAARRGNSWGRTALRVIILVAAFAALVAFSAVLAELTLTPSPASAEIAGSNLQPGHSLRQYLEDYTFLAACKQLGGNILMGVPFGLILPVLVPRRLGMVRVVLLTGVVMALVELAQGSIVQGRAFDVDDVILNTSGALLGYLLLGRRIGRRYHALGMPATADAKAGPAAEQKTPAKPKPAPKRPSTAKPKAAAVKPKRSAAARGESWTGRFGRLGRERGPARPGR
ncbi:VanZ family protein [Streptomyces sp. NPDC006923]|uniref:VanZ family protein n=1 Tax=Streptomyces sp. NPDC006923 TaxID=3155355 RepID=UPI003400EB28